MLHSAAMLARFGEIWIPVFGGQLGFAGISPDSRNFAPAASHLFGALRFGAWRPPSGYLR
jgi:hypothetical protein